MTYNFDIPQPNDNLSNSQGQILTNFQQLNALMGTNATADHYPWDYTTATSRALHKQITLPVPRASDPTLTGDQAMYYTKDVSGVAQAFFANSANVFQLTPINSSSLVTNGHVTFSGGLIIQWGTVVNLPANAGTHITFPIPFPNNTFNIQMTINSTSGLSTSEVTIQSPTNLNYFVYATNAGSNTTGGFWVAIGN